MFVFYGEYTATHCNTLQHTATRCNTLQHAATHCSTLTSQRYVCFLWWIWRADVWEFWRLFAAFSKGNSPDSPYKTNITLTFEKFSKVSSPDSPQKTNIKLTFEKFNLDTLYAASCRKGNIERILKSHRHRTTQSTWRELNAYTVSTILKWRESSRRKSALSALSPHLTTRAQTCDDQTSRGEVGGWGRVPLERWGAGVEYH